MAIALEKTGATVVIVGSALTREKAVYPEVEAAGGPAAYLLLADLSDQSNHPRRTKYHNSPAVMAIIRMSTIKKP